MILRKIIKIVATRCQILTLKYAPKSISAGAPLQTQLGELTINAYNALPDSLLDLMGLLLRGGEGRAEKGMGEEGGMEEGDGGGARPVCLLVLTILATGLSAQSV